MKEDWIEIEFGKLCTFSQGIQVPIKEQFTETNNDRVRFLRIIDFTQGDEPERYVKSIEGNHLVSKNDISMVRYGTVGFVCTGKQGAIANNLFRIIPNINVEKKYLIQFLKSSLFRQYINAKGATMQALSFGLIKPIKIPLAPLPIQRAIVSKIETLFSDLDNGIADLKKAQAQLKIYRQAVLKKAFEGELIIKSKKDKLINVTSKIGSGSTPKGGGANYKESGIPLVRSLNIHFDFIKYDGLAFIDESQAEKLKNVIVNEGDVLLNITGASIGRVNIAPKEFHNGRVNQHVSIVRPKENSFDSKFLKYFLQSSDIQNWISNANYGVTRQALTKGMLENLKIPLPKIEEQHQIVREIKSRLSICDKLEQSITEALKKSEALRQSILKKAFEGKLLSETEIAHCKQEADYEPASVLLEKIEKEKKK